MATPLLTTQHEPTPHELAAMDVLSVLWHETDAWKTAMFDQGLSSDHMPNENYAALYRLICELRSEGKVLQDTVVLARLGEGFPSSWFYQTLLLYDPTRTGAAFHNNIAVTMHEGEKAMVRREIQFAVHALTDGTALDEVRSRLMTALSTGVTRTVERERADEHGADFEAFMQGAPSPMVSTGITWLDSVSLGIQPNQIWWTAGAYKQRKTTTLLNLALHAALNGQSVAFMSREMPQRRVAAQLIAMLAILYMLEHNTYNEKYAAFGEQLPMNDISPTLLMATQRGYKRWATPQVEAVDYAIAQYKALGGCLRIYDTDPKHGGLTDFNSAVDLMRRDVSEHDGKLFFLDYLQLFGRAGATAYEKASESAFAFQQFTQRHPVTLFVAAQLNEQEIRSRGESHSPGIKGGGDPAQTADYLMTTKYNQTDDIEGVIQSIEGTLTLAMHLSRHGRGGANVKTKLAMHGPSGLIIPDQYRDTIDLKVLTEGSEE